MFNEFILLRIYIVQHNTSIIFDISHLTSILFHFQMQKLLADFKSFVANIVINQTRFFEIVDDLLVINYWKNSKNSN